MDEDIEFIKYNTAPSELLKEIDRKEYNKGQLQAAAKTDLDGVVRSLSARVTSYASIHMIPFWDMNDNPCYYTDTDSLFLQYPLEDKFVGSVGTFHLSFKGIAPHIIDNLDT